MNETHELRPMTDREFRLLCEWIYLESGIHLTEAKRTLLVGRLSRRLRALGLHDFMSYYEHVLASSDEQAQLLDAISTNETRFFRDSRQFDFLREVVLPRWRALGSAGKMAKSVRVWSAACSTGEEPYSLAMMLASHLPRQEGWSIEVLASDISNRVLAIAREGMWPIERAEDIPGDYRRAYMLRGIRTESGRMRAHPALKHLITFRRINLNGSHYELDGLFNLIFCRNVLIYFSRDSKAAVLSRLASCLAPSGLLFLGHAESVTGGSHGLQQAGPTAYRRMEDEERWASLEPRIPLPRRGGAAVRNSVNGPDGESQPKG